MPFASVDDIRLNGRAAIVTGAARGLGKTMAIALARAGADVIFADIDGDVAHSAVREIGDGENIGRALPLQCDITKQADCQRAVDMAVQQFGGLHILVNNAARGPVHIEKAPLTKSTKFHEADPAAWQEVIVTNINGTFLMSHCAVPPMIAGGWGRIVNITTSLPTMQRAANSPYGVTKAAIEAETLIWAQDLAGTGVTVNSLIPGGAADTDFVSAETRASMAKTGRTLIAPEVMIAPLLWLVSQETNGVTASRYVGKFWDKSVAPAIAAERAREASVLRDPADELR